MSLETLNTEKHSIFPEEETRREILQTYNFPEEELRVEVVTSADERVKKARDIEAEVMAALGDPIQEVYEEFEPHNDASVFFVAFNEKSAGSSDDIAAMGRIIPYSEQHGNKTLADLAIIPHWGVEGIEQKEVLNLGGELVKAHDPQGVAEAFQREAGCKDISKVWDIATVAPNFGYASTKEAKPAVLVKTVLSAISKYGIEAWERGELTHVTSFNQEYAHGFFVNKLGYPFHNMFGLGPMKYDSFGSDEGMVAQPAWFSLEEFVLKIKQSDRSSYIGSLALGTSLEKTTLQQAA